MNIIVNDLNYATYLFNHFNQEVSNLTSPEFLNYFLKKFDEFTLNSQAVKVTSDNLSIDRKILPSFIQNLNQSIESIISNQVQTKEADIITDLDEEILHPELLVSQLPILLFNQDIRPRSSFLSNQSTINPEQFSILLPAIINHHDLTADSIDNIQPILNKPNTSNTKPNLEIYHHLTELSTKSEFIPEDNSNIIVNSNLNQTMMMAQKPITCGVENLSSDQNDQLIANVISQQLTTTVKNKQSKSSINQDSDPIDISTKNKAFELKFNDQPTKFSKQSLNQEFKSNFISKSNSELVKLSNKVPLSVILIDQLIGFEQELINNLREDFDDKQQLFINDDLVLIDESNSNQSLEYHQPESDQSNSDQSELELIEIDKNIYNRSAIVNSELIKFSDIITDEPVINNQIEHPKIYEQVEQVIIKAVNEQSKIINLQLNPQALGKIEIKLELNNDDNKIIITADQSATVDLLQQDSASLERLLNQLGIKTNSNSLNFNLSNQQQHSNRYFAQQHEKFFTSLLEEEFELTTSSQSSMNNFTNLNIII